MAKAEINVRVGTVRFSGRGEPEWLEEQLNKVLAVASALAEQTVEATLETGTLREAPTSNRPETLMSPAGLRHWIDRVRGEQGRLGAAAEWLTLRSRRNG
ncbi:MAG: hypothetical protein SFV15_02270 [Polyangiaceae bacterium]|nr:hypothetical protein [Polyangiaceae bacterium]